MSAASKVAAIAAEEIDEAAIRKMYEAQVQLLEPQMENEARVRHILAPMQFLQRTYPDAAW